MIGQADRRTSERGKMEPILKGTKKGFLGLVRQFGIIIVGLALVVGVVISMYSLGWLTLKGVQETYGSTETQSAIEMPIGEVVSKCDQIPGDLVKVSGKIVLECKMGTWFRLTDGVDEIFVDLKPANVVLPDRTGKTVTVYGTPKRRGKGCYLEGLRIEF